MKTVGRGEAQRWKELLAKCANVCPFYEKDGHFRKFLFNY